MKANTETELRELDAWISEHVMGIKGLVGLKKRGYWYRPDAHGYTDRQSEAWHLTREEAKKHEYLRGDEPVVICEIDTPHYSTDRAAAMQVQENCCDNLALIVVQVAGEWTVSQITGKRIKASAPTLPLAICKFAKLLFSK